MSDATARCRRIIAAHSKSFALASRLLPREHRDRAVVTYAWCRRADDAVDEASGDAASALARLRDELDASYRGERGSDFVVDAFAEVAAACAIPRDYPAELLAGMEMDVLGARYRSSAELELYCYRVAGVVGLMMCHVMGLRDIDARRNAVHMGIAMQLTNICRDVAEDWQLGRLYLPSELLADCGAPKLEDELGGPLPRRSHLAISRCVRVLLARADDHYRQGDAGLAALPWRSAFAVRTARRVYAAIGAEIAAARCEVLDRRHYVSGARKGLELGWAVAGAAAEIPRRWRRPGAYTVPENALSFAAFAAGRL